MNPEHLNIWVYQHHSCVALWYCKSPWQIRMGTPGINKSSARKIASHHMISPTVGRYHALWVVWYMSGGWGSFPSTESPVSECLRIWGYNLCKKFTSRPPRCWNLRRLCKNVVKKVLQCLQRTEASWGSQKREHRDLKSYRANIDFSS